MKRLWLAVLLIPFLLFGQAQAQVNPNNVLAVNSVSDLGNLSFAQYKYVQLLGYYAPGNGGGFLFWSASSTTPVDGCQVFAGLGSPGTGRWVRSGASTSNTIQLEGCGIQPNTDITAKLVTAENLAGGSKNVIAPAGCYTISSELSHQITAPTIRLEGIQPEYWPFNSDPGFSAAIAVLNTASSGSIPWNATPPATLCQTHTVFVSTSNFIGAPDTAHTTINAAKQNLDLKNFWAWGQGANALMGISAIQATSGSYVNMHGVAVVQFGMYGTIIRGEVARIAQSFFDYSGYQSVSGGSFPATGVATYPFTYQVGANLAISGVCGAGYYTDLSVGPECKPQGIHISDVFAATGNNPAALPSFNAMQVVLTTDGTYDQLNITGGALFAVNSGLSVHGGHYEDFNTGGFGAADTIPYALAFYDSTGTADVGFTQLHHPGQTILVSGSGNPNVANSIAILHDGILTSTGPVVSQSLPEVITLPATSTTFPYVLRQVVSDNNDGGGQSWTSGTYSIVILSQAHPDALTSCTGSYTTSNGFTAGNGVGTFSAPTCTPLNLPSGFGITVGTPTYDANFSVTVPVTFGGSWTAGALFTANIGFHSTSVIAGPQ